MLLHYTVLHSYLFSLKWNDAHLVGYHPFSFQSAFDMHLIQYQKKTILNHSDMQRYICWYAVDAVCVSVLLFSDLNFLRGAAFFAGNEDIRCTKCQHTNTNKRMWMNLDMNLTESKDRSRKLRLPRQGQRSQSFCLLSASASFCCWRGCGLVLVRPYSVGSCSPVALFVSAWTILRLRTVGRTPNNSS